MELSYNRALLLYHRPLCGRGRRIYILNGFPVTEADAAQFLEENHAYFATSSKKGGRDEAQQQSAATAGGRGRENKLEFLSTLDAVVQLTTR